VTRTDGREVVHVGWTPIAQYPVGDVTTRRHVMVQLAEAGRVPGQEIARAFGVTPVYVSQLRGRFRRAGSGALTGQCRGPKGPHKVTPSIAARVRALRAQGLSYHAIVAALTDQTALSFQTVRRILLQADPAQQPLELPASSVEAAAAVAEAPSVAVPPAPVMIVSGETRYAGAMLLHVALSQLGVWAVFQSLGVAVGRGLLSVHQVVGVVAMGFALRLRSIEGFKTALRRDFGRLLGLRVAPSVQTLRLHVRRLAERVDPAVVMHHLAAAWLQLEPVWEGAYYLDGHFCPYAGSRPVPKAWHAQRRLVEPGQSDFYVHDATGRVLFFLNRPLNDPFVKAIPQILQEIRTLVPAPTPLLLIFDRGGYSGPLFKTLTREGIGFLTYLKGRAACRRLPTDRFTRRWWAVTDPAGIQRRRRVVYRISEKATRIRGTGLVRTLVVEDGDAQVPMLTNCAELPAAKAVHLLQMRWRQENSFKYLSEQYGIEQLEQYDATTFADERRVDNPRRAELRAQLTAVQTEIVLTEADLGRALLDAPGPRLTSAQRAQQRELATLETRAARLDQRLRQTPTKVPVATLTPTATRATMKTDRRNLVNAIKIATYNAERWLARRFFRHYQNPRDWLTIFRSVLQLPGTITIDAAGQVCVTLQPPDRPHVRQALAATLEEINAMQARMGGETAQSSGSAWRLELNCRPHLPAPISGVLSLDCDSSSVIPSALPSSLMRLIRKPASGEETSTTTTSRSRSDDT
jgi:hypothetical protein